jgi:hypothetical protein
MARLSGSGGVYPSYREDFFLRGTFAPARRASDSPIAIACLRLFTLRPDPPLRSVPFLRSVIARFTFFAAVLPYFRATTHLRVQV